MSNYTRHNDAALRTKALERAGLPVDDSAHTYEAYCDAVRRSPHVLKHLRPELVDAALCQAAVGTRGTVITQVPERFRTPELYAIAVAHGAYLDQIPELILTPAMQLSAIQYDSSALADVRIADQTREMVKIAMQDDPVTLEYANPALLDTELCQQAVTRNGGCLQWIPMTLVTYDLCLAAVRQNFEALVHVPQPLRDETLYRTALDHAKYMSQRFIAELPADFMTPDVGLRITMLDLVLGVNLVTVVPPKQDALADACLLQHYREALNATDYMEVAFVDRKLFKTILKTMLDSIPLGKQRLDDWRMVRDESGRTAFDDLFAFSSKLHAALPDAPPVQRFHERVNRMAEQLLQRRDSRTEVAVPESGYCPESAL